MQFKILLRQKMTSMKKNRLEIKNGMILNTMSMMKTMTVNLKNFTRFQRTWTVGIGIFQIRKPKMKKAMTKLQWDLRV